MDQPPIPPLQAPSPMTEEQLQALREKIGALEHAGATAVPFDDCMLLLRQTIWFWERMRDAQLDASYHETMRASDDFQYHRLNQQYEQVLEERHQAHVRIKTLEHENAAMRESNAKATEAMRLLAEKVHQAEVQNATIYKIVEQAARLQPLIAWGSEFREICGACQGHRPVDEDGLLVEDAPIEHAPECLVLQAIAILMWRSGQHPAQHQA